MEGGLVEQGGDRVGHVNKVGYGKRVIVKKRKPYHRRVHKKTIPKVPKALQELFLSCRETFKGPGTVPSSQDVQKLCHILDGMKPEDVGLRSDLQFFNPENIVKENPRVTYTTVYRCENFSLCIFFLPAKGVIPLHNHPGMTVFSKLLLGQMHIKSYDWVDPEVSYNLLHQPSHLKLARLKANDVFTAPCDTSVLYPKSGGNIHEFTAITPCAVLDVLGPPYSKEDGRDCSYYRDHHYDAFPYGENGKEKEENDSYGWLEEIEMPENSQMDGIEYLGPQIIETAL
ncbi:plant cysteine oxidase 2 isoform X4 [Cajanus cajan]|uniref:cysteine dioxygenase n=1 Tax=Cajanus cajan TaxID=3821 RepID=A0A151QN69_CAJCA|nr:plant cysteine oxidase 2 isoform X4 [Cajanus cajan]KYP31750.1 2-aminoethanethiol dioxygenase [Cajanus cajan]